MRVQILSVLAVLALSINVSAEQYLCIADGATGFKYDETKKTWNEASFKIQDAKYVISSPDNAAATHAYRVMKLGESTPTATCEQDFNDPGYLFCSGQLGTADFRFNRKNGRYLLSFFHGYYSVLPESKTPEAMSDTPFIEIGKCSPF